MWVIEKCLSRGRFYLATYLSIYPSADIRPRRYDSDESEWILVWACLASCLLS